ncbi:putative secreted protein (Por secretion system target) [Flavobacterium aciduliphilum]|uniref:Putative secreted protein (Por secretion system target) n=2 Tax=Flavobacterium aciduliphilum TaxID=1101402 RepID=A0A328YXP2_9FLAO|nr:putative secreted protein (Por secretion system target) [Flavobacterium aciduliphilum]
MQTKKKSISIQRLFVVVFMGFCSMLQAQVQNNDILYVSNNSSLYVESGNFAFGAGGQTQTTRTPSTHGIVIFAAGVSTSGASDSHYLDGYGSTLGTSAFLMPVGQSGIYAPIQITPSTNAGVAAAYYHSNAHNLSSEMDTGIYNVSYTEYWDVNGVNAALTLTWRTSSALSTLVSSLNNLTIVGYDGNKWVEIPSVVDATSILGGTSTIDSGSIHSSSAVNLSLYQAISLGSKGPTSCNPLVAFSGQTKTWNGSSWIGGTPSLSDAAIISAPYHAGSFSCNSLTLNADVTLDDNQYADIMYDVSGTGKIIMSSEASVVQHANGVGAPSIELTKRTRSVMRRYDYIYWGTPISGDFFAQLDGAQASTSNQSSAFDMKYKYVSGSGGGWQPLTAVETGKGFITRIKNQAPFTNTTNTDYINVKLTGVSNNGDVTVPITNNPTFPNGGTSHVLLANPYPCALDADKFLVENTSVDGVVYIWTSATPPGPNYSQADYIAYTRAGVVIPNNIAGTFMGKIASGQGFEVKSLTNSGSVTFTNCMRLTGNNNNFFKNSAMVTGTYDRFKLNMTGANGVYSQILIGYYPEATLGYDRMYDAGRNSVSTAQLYSIFPTDGRKLAINARPSFFDTDVVPLGVSKSTTNSESFTISLSDAEGIFTTNNVTIFLHDLDQNVYYNLANGPYTFTTASTALNNRFEVVYHDASLQNPSFEATQVNAVIKNEDLMVQANDTITELTVFDITGRKIIERMGDNSSLLHTPFHYPQSVYIAKVKLANGSQTTIKLINKN